MNKCQCVSAKQYLMRYKYINTTITDLFAQRSALLDIAYKVTTKTDGDVVSNSNVSDKVGTSVAKLVDLSKQIDNEIDLLYNVKQEIISSISKIYDDTLELLLTKRYINCKTFEQIAVEMNYTYQWVCALHGRALEKICKIINS